MLIQLKTPLELAGAEEGAAELERAIGKAKALGRNCGGLEKQLAKVREGMRQYQMEHPEGGQRARYCDQSNGILPEGNRPTKEATPKAEGKKEKEGRHRRCAPSEGRRETRRTEEGLATGSTQAATLAAAKTMADTEKAAADGNGPGQDSTKGETRVDGAGTGGAASQAGRMGDGAERMATAGPSTPAAAEPAAEVWEARTVRSALEEVERQVAEEQERARAQRETSREQEHRVAAMELRLQKLEQRGRLNRDGGG